MIGATACRLPYESSHQRVSHLNSHGLCSETVGFGQIKVASDVYPQAEFTDEIGMGIGHLQVVHPPAHGQVTPRALGKVQGIRMIVSFL